MTNKIAQILAQVDDASGQMSAERTMFLLRQAIALDDNMPLLWLKLGHAALDLGMYGDAEKSFERAVSLEETALAYSGLGQVAAETNQHAKAEDAFRRAIALAPGQSYLYVLLAAELRSQAREMEANEELERALSIDPDNEEAMFNLALGCRERDPKRAMSLLRKATQIDSEYAKAYREIGFLCARKQQFVSAREALEHALSIDNADPWTHFYLGAVLTDLGDSEAAERHYVHGCALAENEIYALHLLGEFYRSVGRSADAEIQFRRALQLSHNDSEATFKLGRLLAESRESEEARELLERALELDSSGEHRDEISQLLTVVGGDRRSR